MNRLFCLYAFAVAILAAVTIAACASAPAPHTPESERAARIASATCKRQCPVGRDLASVGPQADHILEDCCVDPEGLGWSSCAWNGCGRDEACRRDHDATVLAATCGGDGARACGTGGAP